MIQEMTQADGFKRQIYLSLQEETLDATTLTVAKNARVYSRGDRDETVYFIESGQIKLHVHSPEQRECLLAIHTAGGIFGELCLSGLGRRLENATAMEETVLRQIPCPRFFARLCRDVQFLNGFVKYMARQLADQQEIIASLATVDSEQRLGRTLLRLAETLGRKTPQCVRIELRITHEELSEMVGTTRPRISVFMRRFKNLGLVDTDTDHFLLVRDKKLTAYLAPIA